LSSFEMNAINKTAGRIALVSGGGKGIGFSIAKKFANGGIKTIIADIHPPQETMPSNIHYINCDVSNGSNIDSLYADLKDDFGLPDILVCNAGRGIHEKLTEGDPEKWQKAFEINVMGALRCIRSFVPEMVRKRDGDVVFISSVSANQPYEYGGIYAATKSAIEVIAETLRLETIPELRIMTVAPGTTDTGFFDNMISGYQSMAEMGFKPISPDEIAEVVWYMINKPKEVSINKVIVRPTPQAF
jgi:NADP-dependent 3-hydroxy acid dehydrogenase YdfG